MKLRQGDPWMPGFRYGALLPPFSLNLLVADTERSAAFYRDVLEAEIHYRDIDFAAMRVGPAEVMLHADHTHEDAPVARAAHVRRGPRASARRSGCWGSTRTRWSGARGRRAPWCRCRPSTRGTAGAKCAVRDPDGYEWAVGVLIPPATGPAGPH